MTVVVTAVFDVYVWCFLMISIYYLFFLNGPIVWNKVNQIDELINVLYFIKLIVFKHLFKTNLNCTKTTVPTNTVLLPETLTSASNVLIHQLKIVPSKCTLYSCLSNVCQKLQFPAVLGNYLAPFFFLEIIRYICELLLKICVFRRNQWAWSWEPQTELARDGIIYGWFWSFHGICWQ